MNPKRMRSYLIPSTVVLGLALIAAIALQVGSSPDVTAGSGDSGVATANEMPGMSMSGMEMEGSIRVSAQEVSSFGITFGRVEMRDLTKTIRAAGFVDFDETRMTYVSPRFGGWIEELYVNFTGQRVQRGQPLLEVYSPELVAAQQELLLAADMLQSLRESPVPEAAEGSQELLESARRRLAYWDISEDQIQGVLESGVVRRTLVLHAPTSGIVMEKWAVQGRRFEPGQDLYMVADLSEVWVNAEIFEADIPLVREGMPAEISIAARPGDTLVGTIEYVYPTLSDRTRSMRARIAIPNRQDDLKPGMYATAQLTAALGETLAIPASAVLQTGERAVAFVDMGEGELMPHELLLGVRGEDFVQVLEGVEPGQRVVTSPQFVLDSESNLAEVMQAMMAQMNLSDMDGMDMPGMDIPDMDMPGMEMNQDGSGPMPPDTSGGPTNMPGMED